MSTEVFVLTVDSTGRCGFIKRYKSAEVALNTFCDSIVPWYKPVLRIYRDAYYDRMRELGREDDDFDDAVYAKVEKELNANLEELLQQVLRQVYRADVGLEYSRFCFGEREAEAERDRLLAGKMFGKKDTPRTRQIAQNLGTMLGYMLDKINCDSSFSCFG